MTLRVVFMGTPEFSVPMLSAIAEAGHTVVAVYCQPPRPAGRGMAETRAPVHIAAEALGAHVLTPASFRDRSAEETFAAHAADVAVVVAYGLLLPEPVLAAPRHGCLNLHASALPRWRGAAPIQRAIMAGDRDTAVMAMRMEAGLDTGPVCLADRVAIPPDMTAGALHDDLSRRGAALMLAALARLEAGTLTCEPQAAQGVTYASKIEKSETRIDFTRPARDVHNRIRGLSPFPGAWFEVEVGGRPERIKVLRSIVVAESEALSEQTSISYQVLSGQVLSGQVLDGALTIACGDGNAVRFLEVQRAGKRAAPAAEVLRGLPDLAGRRL